VPVKEIHNDCTVASEENNHNEFRNFIYEEYNKLTVTETTDG